MKRSRKVKDLGILGSCVTRDALEYLDKENYVLKWYFSRTKIVSQIQSGLNINEQDIFLDSTFQRNMVLADLNKSIWDTLKNSYFDYCIIDYIDERFNYIEIDNTYITKSNELVNSGWLCGKDYKEGNYTTDGKNFYFKKEILDNCLKQYYDKLLLYIDSSQIILHKAFLVDRYIDMSDEICRFSENYLKYIDKMNKLLGYLYDYTEWYFLKKGKPIKVIDVCYQYCATEKHKWGLAPMHYQEEYYIKVAEEILYCMNRKRLIDFVDRINKKWKNRKHYDLFVSAEKLDGLDKTVRNKQRVHIDADDLVMKCGDGSSLKIALQTESGKKLCFEKVIIKFLFGNGNDKEYIISTDVNGVAKLPIGLRKGCVYVNISYEGNDDYYPAELLNKRVTVIE